MTTKLPMLPKGSSELYKKAVELHKLAYKKDHWNKEKYQKRLGHMLQNLYGKSVWTLKDLNDTQLEQVIAYCEKKS